jgi:hypothetical protein
MRPKRSIWRNIGNPITMLHDKHVERESEWSAFRTILFLFAWGYLSHWPDVLTGPAVALAAVIIFGLPIRDLFSKVPVSEALGAIRSFFDNVMGKAAAAVVPSAAFEARQWAKGDPDAGII